MTWYDAQFTDGERRFTVGPFDTPHEAEQFGRAHHGQHLDYTGWAERKGRQELERMVGTLQLNDASRIAEGRRYGVVTRWQPGATQGFITDAEGTSWFVPRTICPGTGPSSPSTRKSHSQAARSPTPVRNTRRRIRSS